MAKREHRLQQAADLFQLALSESLAGQDRVLTATLYEELAYVERSLDELEAAESHYRNAAETYRDLDRPLKTAHTLRHAADILREQKKRNESAGLYAESLDIYRNHPETAPLDLANAIRGLALLKEDQNEREEAASLWREAGKLYELTGIDAGVAESRKRLALLTAE